MSLIIKKRLCSSLVHPSPSTKIVTATRLVNIKNFGSSYEHEASYYITKSMATITILFTQAPQCSLSHSDLCIDM